MTDDDVLVYTRVFDAPPELVFRCMTDPEHLTHFWGPTGTTTPVDGITVDLRVGGAFETAMVSDADGSTYTMRATYEEIEEPSRLVWADAGSGVRTVTTFVALGEGKTEVTIEQRGVPVEYRTPEAQSGFASSLDRFADYLRSSGRAVLH
jgi:uncharacterized protein YndB with AHSA1/START domain